MPNHTLFVLRHAEAEQAADDQADFERDLTEKGRNQCRQLKEHLGEIQFDMALCSPVRRTLETLRLSLRKMPLTIVKQEEFYGAAAEFWLAQIRSAENSTSQLLIVAHNPGLHDLAMNLASKSKPFPRKMPPGTLARFTIPGKWSETGIGKCQLEEYLVPNALDNHTRHGNGNRTLFDHG